MNQILHGKCEDLIPTLSDQSIATCITSPPYATQRDGLYEGISEKEFPDWTVQWMKFLKPKLLPNASVFIVIRPHLKNGQISDYVLKTRLALRQDDWIECEELIWLKSDAPPLGSCLRPRRTYESILWFSLSRKPFVDLLACGKPSHRTGGHAGSQRFGKGTVIAKGQNQNLVDGISRISDVISVPVGSLPKGVMHPAMFPQGIPEFLIQSFSQKGDTILDPFMGSGQTALAALKFDRKFVGIEMSQDYIQIAENRIFALQNEILA